MTIASLLRRLFHRPVERPSPPPDDEGEEPEIPEVVELPIDGVLDLHAFHPRELSSLLPAYLSECRRLGILRVRIIHGKGQGIQQRRVHELLRRLPGVSGFALALPEEGGWGATIALLVSGGPDPGPPGE